MAATGRPLAEWVTALASEGVLVTPLAGRVRMLTHVDISAPDIDTALAAWRRAATGLGS